MTGPDAQARRVLVLNGRRTSAAWASASPPSTARATHADLADLCVATGKQLGLDVEVRQTEYEGELVTWIHQACDEQTPVVLNAGALTHYSYALMDAVKMRTAPLVEVHISNIAAREGFRHESVLTGAATGIIAGFGFHSYVLALHAIAASWIHNQKSDERERAPPRPPTRPSSEAGRQPGVTAADSSMAGAGQLNRAGCRSPPAPTSTGRRSGRPGCGSPVATGIGMCTNRPCQRPTTIAVRPAIAACTAACASRRQ